MAEIRMETLQPRRLLSTTNIVRDVVFDDLLTLAQNYNTSATNNPFAQYMDYLLTLANAYNNKTAAIEPTAFVNDKGKLFIDMGDMSGLRIEQDGKGTQVFLRPYSPDPSVFLTTDIKLFRFTKVRSIEVKGTDRPDLITLGPGLRTTTIFARGGDDLILGSDEDAIIHGGDGNDTVYAGGGNDTVYGDDRLYGSSGNDFLDGGAGKDLLDGGKGKNKLIGGSGTDYLFVRAGKDHVVRDAKDRLTDVIG